MLPKFRWPLPALLTWAAAWGVYEAALHHAAGPFVGMGLGCAVGVAACVLGTTGWRRSLMALGFPLSLLLSGAASMPAWAWLLPLLVLLLIYPLNAWRDAPVFPTPVQALNGLPDQVDIEPDAMVLDAGCGLGDGLKALRAAYPQAQLHGLEWSWPLRALCALRCPWARVRQGDMWRANWSGYTLVYLFQRPESMDRAAAKARAELPPGAWLVSLEFEATTLQAHARLLTPDGRALWVYRMTT